MRDFAFFHVRLIGSARTNFFNCTVRSIESDEDINMGLNLDVVMPINFWVECRRYWKELGLSAKELFGPTCFDGVP